MISVYAASREWGEEGGGAWVKCVALGLNARPREGVGRGQRTSGEAGARGTHRGKSTCSKEV